MTRTFFIALIALSLGGCVVRSGYGVSGSGTYDGYGGGYGDGYGDVYVASAPPPRVGEYVPPPPGPGLIWIEGYWDWTGYDWFWISGRWVPPRYGFAYIAPGYAIVDGRWVYYRSHWRHQGSGQRDYQYAQPSQPYPQRGPAPQAGWRGSPTGQPASPSYGQPQGGWRGSPAGSPAPQQAPSSGAWRGYPSAPSPAPSAPVAPSQWRGSSEGSAGGGFSGTPAEGGGRRAMPAPPQQPAPPASAVEGGKRTAPQPVQEGGGRRVAPPVEQQPAGNE